MKEFSRKVFLAVAPVFGVLISIALLQAVSLPFPPKLSFEALPQWAVFACVIHTSTAVFMFIAERLCGTTQVNAAVSSQATA